MRIRQRFGRLWPVNLYAFSANFQSSALMTIVVPEALIRLGSENHTPLLARLAAASSLIAVLLPPAAGLWSDRLRIRGVRRMSFLLAGGVLNVAGLAGMSFSPSLGVYSACLFVAMTGSAVAIAGYQALWSETVPASARGKAAGLRGAAVLLGNIAGLASAGVWGERAVLAMAVVMAVGLMLTSLFVPEEKVRKDTDVHGDEERSPLDVLGFRESRGRDFIRVFWAQGFVSFGMMLLMTFALYFFHDAVGIDDPARHTAFIAALALAGAVASSLYIGRISDRLARRRLVAASSVPMAAAAVSFSLLSQDMWREPLGLALLAVLFGAGYGAYTSTGWALAVDALPNRARSARDLGLWDAATSVPSVLAPAFGGWVLSLYAYEPVPGYRLLFLCTGIAIAAGGLVVLRVGKPSRRPLGITAFRLLIAAGLAVYLLFACRIRIFGRIPGHKPGMLIISNHLHDIEGMFIPSCLVLRHPLRHPLRFAASQRLFEPGFLAAHYPRLNRLASRVNLGRLFYALGARPVENQPLSRPFISYAYDAFRLHGNFPAAAVFTDEALKRIRMPAGTKLGDFWSPRFLMAAQRRASIVDLREPYRAEFRFLARRVIRAQLDELERELRAGASLYLTPEGRLSENGYLYRLRLALSRLEAQARHRVLVGLSYDPYARRRLSVFVRFAPWPPHAEVRVHLRAVRPITVSQVLCDWLSEERSEPFTAEQASDAVRKRLSSLPPGAFVVPELRKNPERAVRLTLGNMVRLGVLARDGSAYRTGSARTHRAFPHVPDMLAHLRNTFRDTAAALEELATGPAAGETASSSVKAPHSDRDPAAEKEQPTDFPRSNEGGV